MLGSVLVRHSDLFPKVVGLQLLVFGVRILQGMFSPWTGGVLIKQIPSTSMRTLGAFADEFFHSMRMCLHHAEALKVFSCFHADSL